MLEPGSRLSASTTPELRAILDELDRHLLDVHRQIGLLNFEQYMTKRPNEQLTELKVEESRLLSFPGLFDLICDWQDRAMPAELARTLTLWHRKLLPAAAAKRPSIVGLEKQLADRFVSVRYQFEGETRSLSYLRDIVRRDPGSARRRQAWLAMAAPHDTLAGDLPRLVAMRNEAAADLGYNSFVDLMLESAGTSRSEVEGILLHLLSATEQPYRKLIMEQAGRCELDAVGPWDLAFLSSAVDVDPDLFPRTAIVPTLDAWARDHGISLADLGIETTYVDIPYGGLCMDIAPGDIRILANPANGHSYYRTMFHELGHALHAGFNNHRSYPFRRDAGLFHEAMAEVIGHATWEESWLQWYGLDDQVRARFNRSIAGPWLHGLRGRCALSLFEYRLYDDPGADIDTLFTGIESRYLLCEPDPTPRWSANAWYVNYPIYWQNYVLADVIANQIHAGLRERFGGLHGHQAAFDHVRATYMAPGAAVDWQDKLTRDTGRGLHAGALIKRLAKLS